uniref:Peptidase M12B domain-containing protein n=1 Tax=Corethron hystrix TaxID=216773 RepID=A0A7S1BYA4_9STRA|mmetsp:Transcript_5/g.7  ORF Transcript_5/g.7 Transcript_5/m.7 type:complete len:721 (+) Transcript_5:562-2724(+)
MDGDMDIDGAEMRDRHLFSPHQSISTKTQAACTIFKVIELAVVYESTFCADLGDKDTADQRVISLVAGISLKYQQEGLCTKVNIAHIEGHCESTTDPYKEFVDTNQSGCGSFGLLDGFTQYWNDNRGDIHRDDAQLFSGTGLECSSGGCVIGCASVRALCNSRAYGVNYATFSSNTNLVEVLIAHEMGHNCAASHEPSQNYIMYAFVNQASLGFSPNTISTFTGYFNQLACIEDEATGPTVPPTPNPTKTPTAAPTSSPTTPLPTTSPTISPEPTASPTIDLCAGFSSFATLSGTFAPASAGIMFDILAIGNVRITGFSLRVKNNDRINLRIFTKSGSHVGHETDRSSWNWIGFFVLRGTANEDTQSIVLNEPLQVQLSETQAFFIEGLNGQKYIPRDVSRWKNTGGIDISNQHMRTIVGTSITDDNSIPDMGFRGAVNYRVCSGIPSATPSTSAPTKTSSPTRSLLPTESPTRLPTTSPTSQCRDNLSIEFKFPWSSTSIDCVKIFQSAKSPKQLLNRCRMTDANGLLVKDYCSETCGMCGATCIDSDQSFSWPWTSNPSSCKAFFNSANTQVKIYKRCKRFDQNGLFVSKYCPLTCNSCECVDSTQTFSFPWTSKLVTCTSFLRNANTAKKVNNRCNKVDQNGLKVRDYCLATCGYCNACQDSTTQTFSFPWTSKLGTCSSFFKTANTKKKVNNRCKKKDQNGLLIKNYCISTCNTCS